VYYVNSIIFKISLVWLLFDRALFPKLLENCSEGLVNNIIFTGAESHPSYVRCGEGKLFVHTFDYVFTAVYIIAMHLQASASKEVQHLMRCCNSHASFIIAPEGVITRSDCWKPQDLFPGLHPNLLLLEV